MEKIQSTIMDSSSADLRGFCFDKNGQPMNGNGKHMQLQSAVLKCHIYSKMSISALNKVTKKAFSIDEPAELLIDALYYGFCSNKKLSNMDLSHTKSWCEDDAYVACFSLEKELSCNYKIVANLNYVHDELVCNICTHYRKTSNEEYLIVETLNNVDIGDSFCNIGVLASTLSIKLMEIHRDLIKSTGVPKEIADSVVYSAW